MRVIYILMFVFIFIIALLFSLLNLNPVTVYFYKGFGIELPLALVLTLELLAGVLLGLTVRAVQFMLLKAKYNKVKKQLLQAEEKLNSLIGSGESVG